jgi:AAA+ superfamily predicted ATPase
MPAVYLFDEFDALGSDRSSHNDGSSAGAEMRRVVNSLLQFIEDDRSNSVIVAATNHDRMLDRAIFRRFDEVIAFTVPSRDELVELTRRSLVEEDSANLDFAAIYAAVANPKLGHADVCAAFDRVLKDHFLTGALIDTTRVVAAITRRTRAVRPEAV